MTHSGEVIVGVSGGIAAFKAATLVSRLAQAGVGVTAVLTPAAEKFIGGATFAALSGRPVARELFDPAFPMGTHIELARRASLLCIAPASADILAKMATGLADDLLSTLYLCFTGTVLAAPAMNCEMWAKSAVARNVAQLREDGVEIIDPEEGWLSCRTVGSGRMADPEKIAERVLAWLGSSA